MKRFYFSLIVGALLFQGCGFFPAAQSEGAPKASQYASSDTVPAAVYHVPVQSNL